MFAKIFFDERVDKNNSHGGRSQSSRRWGHPPPARLSKIGSLTAIKLLGQHVEVHTAKSNAINNGQLRAMNACGRAKRFGAGNSVFNHLARCVNIRIMSHYLGQSLCNQALTSIETTCDNTLNVTNRYICVQLGTM